MKGMTLVLLALLLLGACKKSDTVEPEIEANAINYLIFGKYYGFCMGDCAHLYKIENGKLYEDATERFYPSAEGYDTINFNSTPLSQEWYDLAVTLQGDSLDELLEIEEERLGCPDCADQGGIYIELNSGGEIRSWNIDTDEASIPASIVPYVQKVKQVLAELEE